MKNSYLVWPALLMVFALARRAKPTTVAATLAICMGSFAIAELTNASAQKFAYYMLPARAGELMLGALLAFSTASLHKGVIPSLNLRVWLGEASSVCGLGLIAFSLLWLDDASPFPGINALYPCLGAALIMFSGQQGSRLTRALLTRGPVVYIGLISYSLYLWHWPILAFIRYFYGEVGHYQAGAALLIMLVLSMLSYHFIEQPVRRLRTPPLRQVLAIMVVPIAVITLTAGTVVRSDGLKSLIESSAQYRDSMATLEQQTSASNRDAFPCMDSRMSMPATLASGSCVFGAGAGGKIAPRVFLWGDSNAGHYIGVLKAIAEEGGFSFRYASLSTCPAVFGEGDFGASYARARCASFRESVERYVSGGNIDTVVLASQWAVHQKNPQFKTALERTIQELKAMGKKVVLLGQETPVTGRHG